MGSFRIMQAFQQVRHGTHTDSHYNHLVWHIDRAAPSIVETLHMQHEQYRLRNTSRYVMKEALHRHSSTVSIPPDKRIPPARRITMGLFMPSHGSRLITDYVMRQWVIERFVPLILHHQRAQELVEALYSALQSSTTGIPDKASQDWLVHWVVSEQFLHAADLTLEQYSTETLADSFTWSQYLLLEDLLEHCANPATVDEHYQSALHAF